MALEVLFSLEMHEYIFNIFQMNTEVQTFISELWGTFSMQKGPLSIVNSSIMQSNAKCDCTVRIFLFQLRTACIFIYQFVWLFYFIFIIVCIIYRLFQCLLNIVNSHFNFSLRFSNFVMSFCLFGKIFEIFLFNFILFYVSFSLSNFITSIQNFNYFS